MYGSRATPTVYGGVGVSLLPKSYKLISRTGRLHLSTFKKMLVTFYPDVELIIFLFIAYTDIFI